MTDDTEARKKLVSDAEVAILERAKTASQVGLSFTLSEPKTIDPYRPLLQFLAGLLAFCLTLLVALFAAFATDNPPGVNALIAVVLKWIAVAAAMGTVAMAVVQFAKFLSLRAGGKSAVEFLIGAVALAVVMAPVYFGVRAVERLVEGVRVVADNHCVVASVDDDTAADMALLLIQQQDAAAAEYAAARAGECFKTGDLASSAAWLRISRAIADVLPAPPDR